MVQFSSKPPFNDDPTPWVGFHGKRYEHDWQADGIYHYGARPEYDRPQHNPNNPILVARRNNPGGNIYYKDLDRWPTFEEIYHAHVVLTRRKAVFG